MPARIVKEEKAMVGRVVHQVWVIEQTGAGPGHGWTLEVPAFFTITLVEVELVEEGEATEVQPFLGLGTGATPDSLSEVVVSERGAKHLRFDDTVRVTAVGTEGVLPLCGWPRPDGVAGRILTRITLQHGHQT